MSLVDLEEYLKFFCIQRTGLNACLSTCSIEENRCSIKKFSKFLLQLYGPQLVSVLVCLSFLKFRHWSVEGAF